MSGKMFVVGRTTPREVIVASIERRFIMDEYLVIQDMLHDNPIGEVIETKAYPMIAEGMFTTESAIYQSLREKALIQQGKGISIAKVKLLDELQFPVTPLSEVTIPSYEDLEEILVPVKPDRGLTLGVIRGTEMIQEMLPEGLNALAPLYDRKKGVIPQAGVPFILDYYAFREYPHVGFFGGSGSGKTGGIRVFCEELMEKSAPGIAFDPHYELNFSQPMDKLPDGIVRDYANKHEIFQIGEDVGIKFTELTTEDLLSLLEFVSTLTDPMRGAIEALHQNNDSYITLFKRAEKLKKIFDNMEQPKRDQDQMSDDEVMLYQQYESKISGSATLQAILWRFDQLNKTGIFDHDISKVEQCLLKRKLAVIRGKQRQLKMLASYLIRKLYGKRREYRDWHQVNLNKRQTGNIPPKFPPFFIITDESHIFAPENERMTPTKAIMREIAQEARKYGVNMALGTQRPALLDKTIASQLNTKIIFRTNIESDMRMIQTETNLNNEQMSRLPDLATGNSFVSSATLRKTFYIRFRTTKTNTPHAEHPFDELDDFDPLSKLRGVLKNYLPLTIDRIPSVHSSISKDVGRAVDVKEIQEALIEMATMHEVEEEVSPFGTRYLAKSS